jgi:hypothetical protein
VPEKALVLDRHERLRDVRGQSGDIDRVLEACALARDHFALGGEDGEGRGPQRLQRAVERRREGQPGDQQHQQDKEDPNPALGPDRPGAAMADLLGLHAAGPSAAGKVERYRPAGVRISAFAPAKFVVSCHRSIALAGAHAR